MHKVFIDTNVFLDLYQTNKNNVSTIFADISKLKGTLVFSEQVYDEFLRNRDSTLQKAINLCNINKIELHTTALIRHLDEFKELDQLKNDFSYKNKELIKSLEKMQNDTSSDPILQSFLSIYNDTNVDKLKRTDEIIRKARIRSLIGNPPIEKKKGTIGDQVIWETLLENLTEDLIFVTGDKTYLHHKLFIESEFNDRTGKQIYITDKVSFALDKIGETPSKELIYFEKFNQRLTKSKVEIYTGSPIVSVFVNLRNFKLWFLDILDIDIYCEDGTENRIEPPEDIRFSPSLEEIESTNKDSEMYDILKECETGFKNEISSILERAGYGKIDINAIEYDIVEYIPPED